MRRPKLFTLAAAFAALALAGTLPATAAKCTKLDFTVNDYGKEGPTRDAKKFLEKKIVDWTRRRGIKNYTVRNRDVSCKLFLNLIVVDEHTCTATAQVCWTDGPAAAPAAPPSAKPGRPAAEAPPALPSVKPKAATIDPPAAR